MRTQEAVEERLESKTPKTLAGPVTSTKAIEPQTSSFEPEVGVGDWLSVHATILKVLVFDIK